MSLKLVRLVKENKLAEAQDEFKALMDRKVQAAMSKLHEETPDDFFGDDSDDDTSDGDDMRPCPMCGEMNAPMGYMGNLAHYRCRACGMGYSSGLNEDSSFSQASDTHVCAACQNRFARDKDTCPKCGSHNIKESVFPPCSKCGGSVSFTGTCTKCGNKSGGSIDKPEYDKAPAPKKVVKEETLQQWADRHNVVVNTKGLAKWFPDGVWPDRADLWHLSDYGVSSVQGGSIWFWTKPDSVDRAERALGVEAAEIHKYHIEYADGSKEDFTGTAQQMREKVKNSKKEVEDVETVG